MNRGLGTGPALLAALVAGVSCTLPGPRVSADASAQASVVAPALSANTKAAWASFVQRECTPQSQKRVRDSDTGQGCDGLQLEAQLRECRGAKDCLPVAQRARSCAGRGPLASETLLEATLVRVAADDCVGVVDALVRSPTVRRLLSETSSESAEGRACVAGSKHPEAPRLLMLWGGDASFDSLQKDAEETVVWMRRTLQSADRSPELFEFAWLFWRVFDALPQRAELLPELRRVAVQPILDVWEERSWRYEAIRRLGELGDVQSVSLLLELMADGANWKTQVAAVLALGAMGPAADEAKGELLALADAHWSSRVRALADNSANLVAGEEGLSDDALKIAGIDFDPGFPNVLLPRFDDSGLTGWRDFEPWSVIVGGIRVEFSTRPRATPPIPASLASLKLEAQFPDESGGRSWRSSLTVVERVSDGWVLGTDSGEFGGSAWWVGADGTAHRLVSNNILGAVRLNGVLYLLQGLSHMGSDQGAMLEVESAADGVRLKRALVLPSAPYEVTTIGDRLFQATPLGVAIVSSTLDLELRPYATRRPPPVEPPSGYKAAAFKALDEDRAAIQECLAALEGVTATCATRPIPAGVSLWFDVDATGRVSAVVPFAARYDDYGRPPTPEVAACIEAVATTWTLPPLDSGWTTFGLTLQPD